VTGLSGQGAIFSAGAPCQPTTLIGGVGGNNVALVPLSGSTSSPFTVTAAGSYDATASEDVQDTYQTIARDGTITGVSGFLVNRNAFTLVGSTLTLTGALHCGDESVLTPTLVQSVPLVPLVRSSLVPPVALVPPVQSVTRVQLVLLVPLVRMV
jgi:hypothetical protein